MKINGLYICRCQDAVEPNTSIHTIKFDDKVSFGDNFFEYLSTKLPHLKCMTVPIYANDSMAICMISTSFEALTISWQNDLLVWAEERTLTIFFNTKNDEGCFVTQYCYIYHVDCHNLSPVSIVQTQQEIEELKKLKRMKKSPHQLRYEYRNTSVITGFCWLTMCIY